MGEIYPFVDPKRPPRGGSCQSAKPGPEELDFIATAAMPEIIKTQVG